MRYRVLGPLEVTDPGGTPLDLGGAKLRALLPLPRRWWTAAEEQGRRVSCWHQVALAGSHLARVAA